MDENLLALAPAAYSQVARVDVAALRASPLWGAAQLAMLDPTFEQMRGATAVDPLPLIDEILVTGGDPKGSGVDEILVVAKGRLDAKALATAIGDRVSPAGAQPDAGHALAAAALTDRTIAVGTSGIVAASKSLSLRQGASLLENPAFADLSLGNGAAVVWRFRRSAETLALDRLRLGTIRNLSWGARALSGDGSMAIADGATIEVAFSLDDPKIAERARRDLKRSFSRLAGNTLVRLLGIGTLLSRIEIGGEAERVAIRASLTAADVAEIQKLFDRINQIRELMADDADGADGAGDPIELEPPMLEREER